MKSAAEATISASLQQRNNRMRYDRFYPGKPWLDMKGKRIHAHGGSILCVDGRYYWYGENKEYTDGISKTWHNGVRMYVSDDLYNWTDLGCIIPSDVKDPASPLYPEARMDRPHILYNDRTKKFVCWIKVMRNDQLQLSTVLTADKVTGPYTIVRRDFQPLGMNAGDFDLASAEDGKAYYWFERVHSELICADLTDDYTGVTGFYSTHFPKPEGVPFVREAPAHFVRKGKHYLLTSGTTGYLPNPSEIAVADTWHGPYKVLGNPHVGDESHTSFHSQISSVFKVPRKKDLYIALADRWLPEHTGLRYDDYGPLFQTVFSQDASREEKATALLRGKELKVTDNTSIADYVWLPILFDGETPRIEWQDEWRLEDYP